MAPYLEVDGAVMLQNLPVDVHDALLAQLHTAARHLHQADTGHDARFVRTLKKEQRVCRVRVCVVVVGKKRKKRNLLALSTKPTSCI